MLHPNALENYFNYFTEIEEHFQKRRGTLIILSPLDWALMEIWKDAGIPLEAVLRGIDASFDKWERRPRRTRKVNGLAYCAQEVLATAEEMKDAAVGAAPAEKSAAGLEHAAVAAFLRQNADALVDWCIARTLLKLLPGKLPKRCAGWPMRSSKAALRRWKTWSAGLR